MDDIIVVSLLLYAMIFGHVGDTMLKLAGHPR